MGGWLPTSIWFFGYNTIGDGAHAIVSQPHQHSFVLTASYPPQKFSGSVPVKEIQSGTYMN